VDARPDVFGHNIETVERLHPMLRDRCYSYEKSLDVLRTAAGLDNGIIIKSAFMVGHGETEDEVRATLADLLDAKCEAVSIGQYLRSSKLERRVEEYITPEQFAAYQAMAYDLGFAFAVAGPFVRSSYHSEEALGARAATT
ncbi:MAG: lipoyl synthase, partial [Nitrospiraceae bacterium]|nr:lipoyl synthase [Nitrospiraceae bacterium]